MHVGTTAASDRNVIIDGDGGGSMMGGAGGFVIGTFLGAALTRNGGLFGNGDGNCAEVLSGRFNALETQIQTNNTTEQFVATNANINAIGRDCAIQHQELSREICELGHRNDMNTQAILTQNANFRAEALLAENTALKTEALINSKLPGTLVSGQVSCSPMPTARDVDFAIQNNSFRQFGLANTAAGIGQGNAGLQK